MPGARRRFAGACFLAGMMLACVEPQKIQTIHHWNVSESKLIDAQPSDEGLQVVRSTAVRTAVEAYLPDGNVSRRTFFDHPISFVLSAGNTTYFVEEISPARNRIIRVDPDGSTNVVSQEGNWTQIVKGPRGHVFGVESLFLSRDIPPSAGRLYNLTRGEIAFEDNFSYHYPFAGDAMLLVSPLDRHVRFLENGKAREIGSVTSLDFPPLVSHDGSRTIWFGPGGSGSTLYLCDAKGHVSTLLTPLTERPVAWLGDDILVGYQDALTTGWILKRTSVADGLVRATIPVPPNVVLTGMLGSPRGDFIGLPTPTGSLLIRLSDGFIQEISSSLSTWRFSRDGSRLWIVEQGDLMVIDLK